MIALMLSEKDPEILGTTTRSDPMGTLSLWSVRARDMIPHLTEQTTSVRGFQILVEAFRLWEHYEAKHPDHAGRVSDFFLLVEQTFARIVGWHDRDWPLPGRRRVLARLDQTPHISLSDPDWHLLDGQKTNGIWGLYRGASIRSGLLEADGLRLADEVLNSVDENCGIDPGVQSHLFSLMKSAMDGETVELPTNYNGRLVRHVHEVFRDVPIRGLLLQKLIETTGLNQKLAERLVMNPELSHRQFMEWARDLVEYRGVIENVIRCENFLAVVEAIFIWMCASAGSSIEDAVLGLPVDLTSLAAARDDFADSGLYRDGISAARNNRMCELVDTSNHVNLARSVLHLHEEVSRERRRAAWVWEDHGKVQGDVDFDKPEPASFQVGVAWRNDYYLSPLRSIARELLELSL